MISSSQRAGNQQDRAPSSEDVIESHTPEKSDRVLIPANKGASENNPERDSIGAISSQSKQADGKDTMGMSGLKNAKQMLGF